MARYLKDVFGPRIAPLMGMTAEITKRKALDWLIERAEVVDAETDDPIDRALLEEPEERSTPDPDDVSVEATTDDDSDDTDDAPAAEATSETEEEEA